MSRGVQCYCGEVAEVNATDILFFSLFEHPVCAQTRLYLYEGLRSTFWPSPRKLLSALHAQPYREGGNPVVWEG